jgi:hypothetical protein
MKNYLPTLTERELDEDFDNGDDEAREKITAERLRRWRGREYAQMMAEAVHDER